MTTFNNLQKLHQIAIDIYRCIRISNNNLILDFADNIYRLYICSEYLFNLTQFSYRYISISLKYLILYI